MTTGAFYGYFSSKEALFASIVEPHAIALMGRFMEAQISFSELPEDQQPDEMGKASGSYVRWMVDYVCREVQLCVLTVFLLQITLRVDGIFCKIYIAGRR